MLELADTEPSGGIQPVSVTAHRDLVYVLNGGVPNSIQGFHIEGDGDLVPIAGSERPLSGDDAGPAQIAFSPTGQFLVVTEKATNSIVTYQVMGDGSVSMPNVQASNGQTPFGFSFNRQGVLLVSEAFGGDENASAVSSYDILPDGSLSTIDASVPTNQTAACWLIVSQNNRYAYTTNTGSGSLTGYRVSPSGSLELLDKDGRTGDSGEGSGPIDVAQSRRGGYVYVLENGTHSIGMFETGPGGSLSSIGEITGLPVGTNGLAAF
jgi:6-phosphogluconolactonase (cycloisomerase 2 family)